MQLISPGTLRTSSVSVTRAGFFINTAPNRYAAVSFESTAESVEVGHQIDKARTSGWKRTPMGLMRWWHWFAMLLPRPGLVRPI